MRKLIARVKKYVPVVIPHLNSLSSKHRWLEFDLTLQVLEKLLQKLPDARKEESVAGIITVFRFLQEKLNPVVEQAVQQKERGPDADVQPPIPLREIQKLLALHQHVATLSRIPQSPKCKHILEKKLVIKRLETELINYDLDLPNLSPTALYPHLFPPTTSKSVPKTKVVETLSEWQAEAITLTAPGGGKVKSHVHAECAVLLDVRKDDRIVHRSYYIGVSKLSCLSCKVFFDAFNQNCTMQFFTKGCHGKIYEKWGDPCSLSWGIEDDSRRDATRSWLNENLLRTLVTALKVSGHSRGGSDSSIASHTSDAPQPTTNGEVALDILDRL